jgi:Viral BACON domain/6-bladed beta-propeller
MTKGLSMSIYNNTAVGKKSILNQLAAVMIVLLLFLPDNSVFAMGMGGGDDPTVYFPIETQLVAESGASATISVQLSATNSSDVVIPFLVTGTAFGEGIDYTISNSSITIPAGNLSADIPLTLTADVLNESDETVIVTMEEPSNAVLGTATVHTLTITDGELPPIEPVPDAIMPDYQRLAFAAKAFSSPTDVTIDQEGRVYVVDSYANVLFRLSQGGYAIDSLGGLATPICVTVDVDGRIYVGNKDRGNVEVYDADFNFLFKLGSGDGEFKQPTDIAIDSSGNVYVVDMKSSSIGIYDSAGNYIGLLGGPGDASGEFHLPVSIAIDKVAQKIIVLDRSAGARVQFFDMAGTYQGCFYKYSTDIGGLIRPQHIAVDEDHRLYITDSAQNVVLVYDNNGNYLDAIYDRENPVRTPLGITLAETNRLYVASRVTGKIEVYGIESYTNMVVEPVKYSITVKEGDENPLSRSLVIRNSGTTTLNWEAITNNSWLRLSDGNGVLEQGQVATPDIAVEISGFTPGKYSGSIAVSGGIGSTEIVQVLLTVVPAAKLSVTPGALVFSTEVGITPYPHGITVANTGSAALHWYLHSDQEWISTNITSGTIPNGGAHVDVTLLPDVSMLTAGIHTGYITVSAPGAAPDNIAFIKVTLILTDPATNPSPTPPPGNSWPGNYNRKWTVLAQTDGISLNSIWGSSSTNIFAVGDSGTILHFDGFAWNEELLATSLNLNSVWGLSRDNVYAVGESGLLLHYDGDNWSDASSTFTGELQDIWCNGVVNCATVGQHTTILALADGNDLWTDWGDEESRAVFASLQGVWGFSESDIYVVGDFGTLLHFGGENWTSIDIATDENLYGIWGSAADNVYVAGQNGTILHYNGTSWTSMESGTTVTLTGIWGNAANDVYAVGEDGTILLYTGSLWNRLGTGITEDLNDAWADKQKEIYVVGSDGSIIVGRVSFSWSLFYPALVHKKKTDSNSDSGSPDN